MVKFMKLRSFSLSSLFMLSLLFLFLTSYYLLSSGTGAFNRAHDDQSEHSRRSIIASNSPDAVLLPDWEVLVLLPPPHSLPCNSYSKAVCRFQNRATSEAFFGGVIRSSGRAAFHCLLPQSARRIRPFLSPRIITGASVSCSSSSNSSESDDSKFDFNSASEMLRWARLWIVYDAVTTREDVLVFAKGVNKQSGTNIPASNVQCVYRSEADRRAVSYAAITSAQEVFRCPHPSSTDLNLSSSSNSLVRISLTVGTDTTPMPSLAIYSPTRAHVQNTAMNDRSLVCACTMVFNVAKFLKEWVVYHAVIGVEKFVLYDNGSEDELGPVVSELSDEGYNVTTYYWPWLKTQEAGFSHCAAVNEESCQWMAFIDVDEFIFSPAWAKSNRSDPSMLPTLVRSVRNTTGQISIYCHEFGPSGLTTHPENGVTQGYTCRRKSVERHKSIVRLDAVDRSLVNPVHHFKLKEGFQAQKLLSAHVKHYKYQVWEEFRTKFRRRVSTYVVDWKDQLNPGSNDRTPGLGYEPVEPDGWAHKFCEQNDTLLRDATRQWFGTTEPDGRLRLKWQRV